jgi:NADH:ubiquinone oxidoreductase subunit 6 (subunit J)
MGKEALKKHIKCLSTILFTAFAIGALSFLFLDTRQTIIERFQKIIDSPSVVLSYRTDIWEAALAIINNHVYLGTGLGTFFLYYPEYRLESEIHSSGYMAHSDPLQLWAEAGILGPILFYLAAFFVVLKTFRALREKKLLFNEKVIILASFCAMGAFFVHTHISYNLYVAPLLILFGLILSCWYSAVTKVLNINEKETEDHKDNHIVRVVSVLPLFFLYILLQGFLLSEFYSDRARQRMLQDDVNGFASDVNLADKTSFGLNARAYILAASVQIGLLHFEKHNRDEIVKQAKEFLEKAYQYNPRMVSVPYYYGLLYSSLDASSKLAEKYFKEAVLLNPLHLPSREMLMQFYINNKNPQKALEIGREGLAWKYIRNNPVNFYNQIILLMLDIEDIEGLDVVERKARQAMKEFSKDPSQENVLDFMQSPLMK